MAGTPTFQEIIDNMLKPTVDVFHDHLASGSALITKIAVIEQGGDGDYGAQGMPNGAASVRSALNAPVSDGQIRAQLEPVMQELGVLANSPFVGRNLNSLTSDVFLYLQENGHTFKSRAIAYGTPTPNGSNRGDGTVYRLTVDEYGNPIENCHVETKTLECILDQNNGRDRHAEVMRLYGADVGFDFLSVAGSAIEIQLPSRHSGQDESEGSVLSNSSFDTGDAGGTETTRFPGWTIDTPGLANVTPSTENFRGNPQTPAGSEGSLEASGDFVATQILSDIGAVISHRTPYSFRAMVYPVGVATGNIVLGWGDKSQSFAISGMTPDTWNEIVIDLDRDLWPSRWNSDQAAITISGTSISGVVRVDDAIFAPMTPFDATWCVVFGGDKPFLAGAEALQTGDEFTWADTGGAPADAKIQYCFWRGGYGNMPNSGTPTITDP